MPHDALGIGGRPVKILDLVCAPVKLPVQRSKATNTSPFYSEWVNVDVDMDAAVEGGESCLWITC